ncbi:hypothetical protein B5P43_07545 [Bacillus sp. SRB_336]|nr:hypothetical protein B5P43_07545 [Bacillus sp. SRB_336]
MTVEPSGKVIRLNKVEAATRQLDGAITLFLAGADLVCVTTVTHAAALILHDLVQLRVPESSASGLFTEAFKNTPLGEKIKTEGDYRKLLREGPNWLKHARDDPDSEYDSYPDMPPVLMFIAITDSIALDAMTVLQEMFMAWMVATYHAHDKSVELSKLARQWFPFDASTTFEQRLAIGHARAQLISSGNNRDVGHG